MNLGLSDLIKSNFKNTVPVERPIITTNNIPDSNWVAGFTTGEGNFDVRISHSKSVKIGYYVTLRFRIYQLERDIQLLNLIIKYLGAGKIEKQQNTQVVSLTINKISEISNIVIPFFKMNPILGVKELDYLNWCKIAKLMNEEKHLTVEGLGLIREIKSKINRGKDK